MNGFSAICWLITRPNVQTSKIVLTNYVLTKKKLSLIEKSVVYKQFPWSLQGSKWAIVIRPVSTESTLLLFLLMSNFLDFFISFFQTNFLLIIFQTSFLRSGSRIAATSKMERFEIIVNGWKPLTIITKRSILDVAAVLDPPLLLIDNTCEKWCKSYLHLQALY